MSLLTLDPTETTRFRAYGPRHINEIAQRYGLPDDVREAVRLISMVLPFRVNEYVLSELIDWRRIPEDPVFQLVFPSGACWRTTISGASPRRTRPATGPGSRRRCSGSGRP